MENVYIIGDVHGCFKTLMALIEQLPNKHQSKLVFVGDLVDRGPNSFEVVDYVKKSNHLCVMGNHEAVMLECFKKVTCENTLDSWLKNGGEDTLISYGENSKLVLENHLQWISNLPKYLEFDIKDENNKTLFITHGFGLPYWKNKHNVETEVRLRVNRINKSTFYTNPYSPHYKYEKNYLDYSIFNVFGHTPQNEIWIHENFAAIDTGCVFHQNDKYKYDNMGCGYLTALEYPSKKVFKQINIDN